MADGNVMSGKPTRSSAKQVLSCQLRVIDDRLLSGIMCGEGNKVCRNDVVANRNWSNHRYHNFLLKELYSFDRHIHVEHLSALEGVIIGDASDSIICSRICHSKMEDLLENKIGGFLTDKAIKHLLPGVQQ